MKYHYP